MNVRMAGNVSVFFAGIIGSCVLDPLNELDRTNPVDPGAPGYQGYTTVDDVNDVVPAIGNGAHLDYMVFPISEVVGGDLYKLQFASVDDFSVQSNIIFDNDGFATNVMAPVTDMSADTTYYWRGAAQKNGSWGDSTQSRSFVMNDLFNGRMPIDGEVIRTATVTLSWDAVTGAASYEVQIASTEAGIPGATPVTATAHSYTWPTELSDGDELHWRGRAINSDGAVGGWSSIAMLTYDEPLLASDTYFAFQPVIATGATATFSMGSTDGTSQEQPVHSVTLTRPYSINTYEVTNDQFAAVMNEALDRGWVTASTSTVRNVSGNQQELLDVGSSDCRIDYSGGRFVVNSGYGDHPVTEVTWYGAVAFAFYLNELLEVEQTYDLSDWSVDAEAAGYRLPSEAEWEYAARGGSASNGYTYAGSNDLDVVAWYGSNSGSTTHTVGTKAANEIGTYDMSGNVYEWVQDWYGSTYYSSSPGSDPIGPASGSYRVIRGCGWNSAANYLPVSYRTGSFPDNANVLKGFRLVVDSAP